MAVQYRHFTNIFKHLTIALFVLPVVLFVLAPRAYATAGILKQINFQGKVVNTNGTNVTNGDYTFLFCLYTVASPATACTAGANNDAVWRESKTITVTDGVFQTLLGDTTVLPGSVDFNSDNIYLGVNFNSDGQMTPLVRFSAVPYAFNADKIHGLTVTDTTGTFTLTNGKTFTVSNTLTFAGTDSTSFTFPSTSGGTVLVNNISGQSIAGAFSLTGTSGDLTLAGTTGLTFSGTGGQINFTLGETIDNDTDGILKFTAPHASFSGTLTVGQGQTIRSEYGPLQLAYKSGGNAWTTGATLQDTTGNLGVGTTAPDARLEINHATGDNLRLTYNDSDGGAANYTDFNLSSDGGLTIDSTGANIKLQVDGTSTTGNVQIGAGGAGSTTPDLLILDIKSDAEGALAGSNGAIYYNASTNKFRCYQSGAWTDCIPTSAQPKESHVIFFSEPTDTAAISF